MARRRRNNSAPIGQRVVVIDESVRQPRRRRRKNNSSKPQGAVMHFAPVTPPISAGVISNRSDPVTYSRGSSTFFEHFEVLTSVSSTTVAHELCALIPSAFNNWLSTMAKGFDRWRWLMLRFIYVPSCATTTPGMLAMGIEYDYSDSIPTSLNGVVSLPSSVVTPLWGGVEGCSVLNNPKARLPSGAVVVEVDTKRNARWYPYLGGTPFAALSNADRMIYAPGRLIAVTENGPTTPVSAGIIFVQYRAEVCQPISSGAND